ncbi:longitudinals lacking protein, isoforms H/M/V isoform X10 [Drosophila hydei]|uniref:Longitudinals lacking protein, isoforms H/M/V isoform X10 n=1 Tax=Drosophila hydei TaxID=7224 RepID=A0A6J1LTS3_DROHY|nr:longitudinals lacking protein, isoforms H/M/V isoform X10 [Drosophila hydei]
MDDDQQFCLRWNNHQSTLISVFDTLLENETLVDCTLAAEGKFLKAHKVVLSACSPYFATLLQEQYDKHPIFILKDVKYQELRAMMDYMYRGEVNISQDQLTALLKAAESLQIKGLSDNRSGTGPAAAAAAQQQQQAPKPDTHHRVKLSAPYTLEQTKRARITTGGAAVGVGGMVDAGDVAGSREGSSSPSRRRRKVRRRSMENDLHDNSNSSVLAAVSNQSILQQTSAGLAASALVSTQLASVGGAASATAASATACGSSSGSGSQVTNQPLTSSSSSSSNVTKKTESAKLTSTAAAQGAQQQQQQQQQQTSSDAINTDNVQQQQQNQGAQGDAEEMDVASGGAASGAVAVHPGVVKQLTTLDKSNHKQKIKDNSITTEMVIEPKAEYDDDAHDENVEDLTLDEEDMTMEELDQAAGTSQGGEGSSQAYATWQHDRSQDELGLMAAQDAQQRDPQGLLELSLNQSSSFYYEPDIPLLLEPPPLLLPPSSRPPPPMTTRASGPTLRRGKLRSRKRRNNSAALAAAAAAKKLMAPPPIPQPPLLERSSSAATLARNAELRDDGKLQCPQCPNAYTRLSALKRHIEFECGQLENFRCSVCDAGFKRKDSLNRHCKVKKHITKYLY